MDLKILSSLYQEVKILCFHIPVSGLDLFPLDF